jgi:hypothetical protein
MQYFYAKGISLIAVSGPAGYLYPSPAKSGPAVAEPFAPDRSCAFVLSLMAGGGLEPKRLVTHRFHYSEMVKAYEMAYQRDKSMLGVIFQWRG